MSNVVAIGLGEAYFLRSVAIGKPGRSFTRVTAANGANGMSDIEGKVAREAMSECGQRANFNAFGVSAAKIL